MIKTQNVPQAGDRVKVSVEGGRIEKGILLDSHDRGVLLLKLDNGYNIGLKKEDIFEINVIKKKKKQKKKEELKLSGKKPIIDFYLTGGTISSKLDPETGGVKWLIDAKELFSMYPDIFEIADIRLKTPFSKASENMDFNDWIRLAKMIGRSLKNSHVKGVIISHGTDFLHYTSSALSFMLGELNKPVILTYSQRSSDRGSSDAQLNLICSAHMALSDVAEVMLVGHANINDNYCYALQGNKCRKMHSSRRDTFRPINCKPISKIWANGKIEMVNNNVNKRSKKNKKVKVDAVFDDRVGLIKFYPGQDPKILDFYRKKGYRGIIIEMSGLGHVISEGKNNWIPKLKEIIERGMFVYAVPQTLYGRLDPYVYSPGRKLKEIGVVFLKDILPETALVKLGYVLAKTRGRIAVNKFMTSNLVGEFNDKLGIDFIEEDFWKIL